jgi:hypothetical protein
MAQTLASRHGRRRRFRAGLDGDDLTGQVKAGADGQDAFWTTPVQLPDETLPEHVVELPFDRAAGDGGSVVRRLDQHVGGAHPDTTSLRAWALIV